MKGVPLAFISCIFVIISLALNACLDIISKKGQAFTFTPREKIAPGYRLYPSRKKSSWNIYFTEVSNVIKPDIYIQKHVCLNLLLNNCLVIDL